MKHALRLAGLLCLALVADSALALVTEDDINRAYYQSNAAQLEKLRTELDESNAADAVLAGYIDWRLASIRLGEGDEDGADAVLERGQATLERLVEAAPDRAEGWALLSTTLGMRIGMSPMMRGMRYGPAADAAIEKALELEPDNPRVLVIHGIGLLSKPSLFGGDEDGALEALDAALASVASNGTGRYAWGEADAYVWRGIAHKKAGRLDAATRDFNQALVVVPSYTWAKHLLGNVDAD